MTLTLQILCDGVPCGVPLSETAARAWLEFVQHVPAETAKAMVTALRPDRTECTCLQQTLTSDGLCPVHGIANVRDGMRWLNRQEKARINGTS